MKSLDTNVLACFFIDDPDDAQAARQRPAAVAALSEPSIVHGSWLNMAETEIGIMGRQCLDRRLDRQERIATEIAAWENRRNALKARIHWTFTLAVARRKLRKL